MIGVLDADPAGAEALGHVHGKAVSVRANDKAQAIVAVDRSRGGRRAQHSDLWLGINAAQSKHVEIAMQAGNAMGIDSAQVRGSEDFGGLGGVLFGNSKVEKHAFAEIAQRFDGENFGLHFGHVFIAFQGYAGRGCPRVSAPNGIKSKPTAKAMEVSAMGITSD